MEDGSVAHLVVDVVAVKLLITESSLDRMVEQRGSPQLFCFGWC